MFIEDMARNGLNLYFDSDIRRLSFSPEPKMMSTPSISPAAFSNLPCP